MPVDIAGLPCDYDEINKIVNDKEVIAQFNPESINQERLGRILVLSDAAHSVGAFYKSKACGVLADITIFSFHAVWQFVLIRHQVLLELFFLLILLIYFPSFSL